MAEQTRSKSEKLSNPGPYLARVVNHLDTTYMGGLIVSVVKNISGIPETETSNVPETVVLVNDKLFKLLVRVVILLVLLLT